MRRAFSEGVEMARRRITHRVCCSPAPARLAQSDGGSRALLFAEHAQNFKGRPVQAARGGARWQRAGAVSHCILVRA
jgi:hypothetical protein